MGAPIFQTLETMGFHWFPGHFSYSLVLYFLYITSTLVDFLIQPRNE